MRCPLANIVQKGWGFLCSDAWVPATSMRALVRTTSTGGMVSSRTTSPYLWFRATSLPSTGASALDLPYPKFSSCKCLAICPPVILCSTGSPYESQFPQPWRICSSLLQWLVNFQCTAHGTPGRSTAPIAHRGLCEFLEQKKPCHTHCATCHRSLLAMQLCGESTLPTKKNPCESPALTNHIATERLPNSFMDLVLKKFGPPYAPHTVEAATVPNRRLRVKLATRSSQMLYQCTVMKRIFNKMNGGLIAQKDNSVVRTNSIEKSLKSNFFFCAKPDGHVLKMASTCCCCALLFTS